MRLYVCLVDLVQHIKSCVPLWIFCLDHLLIVETIVLKSPLVLICTFSPHIYSFAVYVIGDPVLDESVFKIGRSL